MEQVGPLESKRIKPQEIAALLKQHGAALVVYASQWTTVAEDCVQDAFVKLATQSPPPTNLVSWLFKVTRNQAINSLRARNRRTEHEALASHLKPGDSDSLNPATVFEQSDERARLMMTLDQLDDQQREVVTLRIWSELTWAEIAELMETSSSSAHRTYATAIARMKELLETSCLTKRI